MRFANAPAKRTDRTRGETRLCARNRTRRTVGKTLRDERTAAAVRRFRHDANNYCYCFSFMAAPITVAETSTTTLSRKRDCGRGNDAPTADGALCRPECGGVRAKTAAARATARQRCFASAAAGRCIGGATRALPEVAAVFYNPSTAPPPAERADAGRRLPNARRPRRRRRPAAAKSPRR